MAAVAHRLGSARFFTSAPTACSAGFSTLHIFGLGTDFQMYHKFWNGSQWLPSHTDWEPLGGVFTVPRPTLFPGSSTSTVRSSSPMASR